MSFDALEKAGINGLIAGAATIPLFGTDATIFVPFANSSAPLSVLAFAVGATGSIVGDLAHCFIKDDVDISEKWKDRASLISGVVINGALFAGLLHMYDPKILEDFGKLKAVAVGGGAEFAGAASYSYLKENLYL